MTTGATGQLGLALPVQGELSGTWGDTVNNGITQYTNIAIAATLTLTNDGAVTLANTTGDASATNITSSLTGAGTVTAQFAIVKVTGTLTTAKVITAPSYSKTYVVVNAATGGIVTFKASGQTGVSIAVGESAWVYYNGTDYVKIAGTTSGAAGGSNTQVQYNSSGSLAGSSNLTFDGTNLTLGGGTANGVTYLNGSKVLTSGSALTFDGTNLGVGNASSRTLLDILSGTANTTGDVLGQAIITGPDVAPAGTGGSGNLVIQTNSNQAANVGGSIAFGGRATDSSTVGRGYAVIKGAKENSTSANRDGYFAIFTRTEASGQTEKLRVDSAGNLGLGVTPSAWASAYKVIQLTDGAAFLEGGGNTYVSNNWFYDGTNKYIANGAAAVYGQSGGSHQWFTAASGTAGNAISFTQAMTLEGTDRTNLLVGTTSSLSGQAGRTDLSVNGSSTAIVSLGVAGARQGYFYTPSTGAIVAAENGPLTLTTTSSQVISFNTNNVERGRFSSGGAFMVGTASGTERLTLASGAGVGAAVAFWGNGVGAGSELYVGQGGSNEAYFFNRANSFTAFGTNNTEKIRISAAGGFSVGTTADPGAGAIYATGNITAYYSDDRLKTRLGIIENALDKVDQLQGFYYEANETAQALGYKVKREVGVSAQSVQAVLPEIVSPAPIDQQYLTVDYERLVPLLIEAVKELTAKVKALEAK